MNATKIIDRIKRLKPNALMDDDLIDFINEIEARIAYMVVYKPFVPVTSGTLDFALLAPPPFDLTIYLEYVASRIDLINGNIEMYSLSSQQFNSTWTDMADYCIKNAITPPIVKTKTGYY